MASEYGNILFVAKIQLENMFIKLHKNLFFKLKKNLKNTVKYLQKKNICVIITNGLLRTHALFGGCADNFGKSQSKEDVRRE